MTIISWGVFSRLADEMKFHPTDIGTFYYFLYGVLGLVLERVGTFSSTLLPVLNRTRMIVFRERSYSLTEENQWTAMRTYTYIRLMCSYMCTLYVYDIEQQ